jgi:hypothetical protein
MHGFKQWLNENGTANGPRAVQPVRAKIFEHDVAAVQATNDTEFACGHKEQVLFSLHLCLRKCLKFCMPN